MTVFDYQHPGFTGQGVTTAAAGQPSGGTGDEADYKYALLDSESNPMPFVWINEWTDPTVSGTNTVNNPWYTLSPTG